MKGAHLMIQAPWDQISGVQNRGRSSENVKRPPEQISDNIGIPPQSSIPIPVQNYVHLKLNASPIQINGRGIFN